MKKLFAVAVTMFSFYLCQAQGVFTLEAKRFGGNDRGFTYGITMSGAGILHEPGDKKTQGIILGAGAGLHLIEQGSTPYIPVFLEIGYINKVKKIFPYLNVRAGYGFNDSKVVKGGFYSEFRGGASFKVGVCRFTPFIGLSISQFRVRSMGETLASTNEGTFVGGIAFVFAR